MCLRPEAKRAHGRAAPRRVERDERIQKKRHVVARYVQIALIHLSHPGKLVQVLDHAAFRVVHHAAVLAKTHARQFFKRLALGIVRDLVIELAAHHEVDRRILQRLLRLNRHGRSYERHFHLRIGVLHHFRHLQIDLKAGTRGEKHQQLKIFAHFDRLLDRNLVGRRVHHSAVGEHAGWITKPDRIPIGFDFAGGRPA